MVFNILNHMLNNMLFNMLYIITDIYELIFHFPKFPCSGMLEK